MHEYGFTVEIGTDGPRFLDERGREVPTIPARPRPSNLGWDAIIEHNRRFEITAATNEPGWDGCAVDYVNCIDALVRADGLQ